MSVLIWMHVTAAIAWIGGMLFLSLVLVPVLRREEGGLAKHARLFRTLAYRFRTVVWGAMGTLVVTGLIMADARAIPLATPALWPTVFAMKMMLVALLFAVTLLHDLLIGPRVRRIMSRPDAERSSSDRLLMRYSMLIPRFSLLLALAVVLVAVQLARL